MNFITSAGVVIGTQNWTTSSASLTAYVLDVDDNGNVVKTVTATVTDSKAAFSFTELNALENGTYTLKGKDLDGNDVAVTLDIDDGQIIGSSGYDAGFGAFALLALGATVVFRKKD